MNIMWTIVLSSLTAMVVPAAVAFVFKDIIAKWIGSSLQHGFDVKLAELNGRIKAQQDSVSDLRSGALSVLSKQHEALNNRVLQACERLWEAVQHDKQCDFFLSMIAGVNLIKTMEIYERKDAESDKIKEFFKTLWESSGLEGKLKEGRGRVSLERPFLSDDIYAAYSAYVGISGHIILAVSTMRCGAPTSLIKGKEETAVDLKRVLPHQAENIDKFDLQSFYFFRGEIEALILKKISKVLFGNERALSVVDGSADVISVIQNAEIKSKISVPDSIQI